MLQESIDRLAYLCDKIPALLAKIDIDGFESKPSPDKWSKKEILGHLIDSATNNHQRFIRGQYEHEPKIVYDQNEWNRYNFYQQIDSDQIISFWTLYNKQLLEIVKRIEPAQLSKKVNSGETQLCTIEFLIEDYVLHLEHHLKQILEY